MTITEGVDDFCSHPYLVCLWRETEGSPWRASLRHAQEQRAIPFPDLETLALYLLNLPEHPHRTPGTATVTPRVFTSGFEAGGDERSGS